MGSWALLPHLCKFKVVLKLILFVPILPIYNNNAGKALLGVFQAKSLYSSNSSFAVGLEFFLFCIENSYLYLLLLLFPVQYRNTRH